MVTEIKAQGLQLVMGLKKGDNGQGIGKSRGGLTSKIYAVTNSNGNAMNFIITGGNINDCTKAENVRT